VVGVWTGLSSIPLVTLLVRLVKLVLYVCGVLREMFLAAGWFQAGHWVGSGAGVLHIFGEAPSRFTTGQLLLSGMIHEHITVQLKRWLAVLFFAVHSNHFNDASELAYGAIF